MKKFIFIISFFSFLFSEEITTLNISKKSLNVLHSFDIEDNFLMDKDTQDIYNSYTKSKKRYLLNVLENGYSYIPLIRKEIKKANFPENLVFVAMAESHFTSDAISNKKAVGLWQFMPETAKRLNLKMDTYIDERQDPIKSTIAAITYLSYLKKQLHKWYLAIMAYNCGEARIIEAITRAKLDKYCETHKCHSKEILEYRHMISQYTHKQAKFKTLWKVYKKANKLYPDDISLMDLLKFQDKLDRQYLPKETRRYIRKIVAMSFLINSDDFIQYQNQYLLNSGNTSDLVRVDVPTGTSLEYIAKTLNIDYQFLRLHNMHLKYGFTPPSEESYIYIPYDKLAEFKIAFNDKNISKKMIYSVKKGDTLRGIAKKFDISYKVIKDFNHLSSDRLHIKQKLIIPIKHTIKIKKTIVYKVQKGDNLFSISRKFHTTPDKIKKRNHLKNNIIYQKQTLVIPGYRTID